MKNYFNILFLLFITSICFSQKLSDSKSYIQKIEVNIDKEDAHHKFEEWVKRRYTPEDTKLKINKNEITSMAIISMAFRSRQMNKKIDINYYFYHDLSIKMFANYCIVEMKPTIIEAGLGQNSSRIDKTLNDFLLIREAVSKDSFLEMTVKNFADPEIGFSMSEKKARKLIKNRLDTLYSDYLFNFKNYKNEIKSFFDSLDSLVSPN